MASFLWMGDSHRHIKRLVAFWGQVRILFNAAIDDDVGPKSTSV